jgi:hypothetical protein
MLKLNHDALIGRHEPNGGEGLTIRELIDLLRSIPPQARGNYIGVVGEDCIGRDVAGISFAQSDQAQRWEFHVHLTLQD